MAFLSSATEIANQWVDAVANIGKKLLFWNVFPFFGIQFPFLIMWLIVASLYFMVRTKLYTGKSVALSVKYFFSKKIEKHQKEAIGSTGEYNATSKSSAMFAVGSNVDLGTVFGTAVAVQIGGLGVLFWMMVAAMLSISVRFVEVFVSHFYRVTNKRNGSHAGGPQHYIEIAFSGKKTKWIGKGLKIMFSTCVMLSTFFSPQINQTVEMINHFVGSSGQYNSLIALSIAGLVIAMLTGGFHKMASKLRNLAPPTGYIYVSACFAIIAFNSSNIWPTIKAIFVQGLSLNKGVAFLVTAIALGSRRAFFCLETGMGSAGMTHAGSINKNSFSEALFSSVEPLIAVFVVALCSGFVVGVTNSHLIKGKDGIEIMIHSFQSVHHSMQYILLLVIPLFGISTAIAWAYYGKNAWINLFGERTSKVYVTLLFIAYWSCGQSNNFKAILNAADFINLSVAIPNITALYFIANRHLKYIGQQMSKPLKELDAETEETFFQEENTAK